MGIADFFRPKYRHSDARVRSEAVRALTPDDAAVLAQVAKTDRDAAIRRIAIEKLDEPDVLAAIAKADDERANRDLAGARAAEILVSTALDEDDDVAAAAALDALIDLGDQRALAEVAGKSTDAARRARALKQVSDPRALAELAKSSADGTVRLDAVAKISDADALRALAVDSPQKDVAIAAVDRIEDATALEQIAQKAKSKQAKQRARRKLSDREEAAKAARPKVDDEQRRRKAEKVQLLRKAEELCETFEWVQSKDDMLEIEAEWMAIGDSGDKAQEERLQKAVKRYHARREVHMAKQAEARAPRREERPEPVIEDKPEPSEEIEIVRAPAPDPAREARAREAAERREERDRQQAEFEARRAQEQVEKAARAKEAAERGVQIAASLAAMCADLEQLAESKDGRALNRMLEQAGKAFEQIGKVAPAERDALTDRYGAIRAKLVIKNQDLREAEDWQRFANVPKLEALIREAEALAAAEAPSIQALQALQKAWKSAGPVPQKRSQELWEKFKLAADAAFGKIKGAREVEKAQWDDHVKAREALIAEATTLAESSDWEATALRLKELQAQWKTVGPVPRRQGDELWQQFRSACDKFFERRKPMLDARHAEQDDNLVRKQALCARVEALVASAPGEGGWGAAITAVKNAQFEWRDIGFVPRKDADAIYARFRAACDGLFAKRDDARDAETDAERAELDGLRAQFDAVIAGGDDVGAKAIAAHGAWRAALGRDLRPGAELTALHDRMIAHVATHHAVALRGTELDVDAMAKKRDAVVARAEALLPKDAPTVSGTASPDEVAAVLRAALKSNALNKLRMDSRDPREIIDELRGEWAAIGPILGDASAAAASRFEAACAQVVEAAGGARSRPDDERDDRTRDDRGRGRRREGGEAGDSRRERRPRREAAAPAGEAVATEAARLGLGAPAASATAATAAVVTEAHAPVETAAVAPVAIPTPLSAREPLPAPPVLPAMPRIPSPTSPPRTTRPVTIPPPDPIDETWDEPGTAAPVAAAPTAPESSPPASGEMASDGAAEGDGIDSGWD
jgi:hypothetical protein